MALLPVNTIEVKEGEVTFHLASTASNDDWIRSARLKNSDKDSDKKKLEELEATKMLVETNI